MSRPMIKIHNALTNEIIEREMNDQELAQYESDKNKAEAEKQAIIDAENKKQLLLEKLGISAEEAKLLLQ